MSRKYVGIAVVLLNVAFAGVALAQEPSITASIPFDFYVGHTLLPAGPYVIESPRPGMQLIRAKETNVSVASVATIAVRTPETLSKGTLVFNLYGNEHFLTQILWGGTAYGREIVKHGMEVELAKTMPRPSVTRIALNQR